MESSVANDSDVWKWANKLHFGLTYKDQLLEWDRRNPGYTVGMVVRPDDPLELSRHFLHCLAGDFRTDPDPYGTVYRFAFTSPERFFFAHNIFASAVCVSLGSVGYVVFVRDWQALRRDVSTQASYQARAGLGRLDDMLFFYANCVEHLARHELGQTILMTDGLLVRAGNTVVHRVEPFNKKRFRAHLKLLGLEWIDTSPDRESQQVG